MKVIVFGATGKTGQHVLRAALAAGHGVTAFGRSVDRIDIDDPALETHKGDVVDTDSVTGAVAGHDAVIVCLGSTGLRDKTKATCDRLVKIPFARGFGSLNVSNAAAVGLYAAREKSAK